MQKQRRTASPNSALPLLKTCQTCFNAKIRCDRSQDSTSCDRCLRLRKTCVFSPARRRNVPAPRSRIDQLEAKIDRVLEARTPSPNLDGHPASENEASSLASRDHKESTSAVLGRHPQLVALAESSDAIGLEIVGLEMAEKLLRLFRTRMTSYFPFVILDGSATVENLRLQRPMVLLATLAVASFEDFIIQRRLSSLFNDVIAARMACGDILSMDVLQGLLVHLAWAHYHPRPRRYSQHLHLATSIVSDLRLYQPRRAYVWNLEPKVDRGGPQWSSDEIRALIGTYYLASTSAIILQKMRHFPYRPFILESCERLAVLAEHPSDTYLTHIVRLQCLAEDVDDIVLNADNKYSLDEVNKNISGVRDQVNLFKSSLTFALNECPVLLLQLHTLELFISQLSLPGIPFAIKFQHPINSSSQLIEALSLSFASSKSLINIFLTMTPGEEFALSNLGWIMISCALSLAVRFDVLADDHRISHLTQHLRGFLDTRHTLRQVILRLDSITSLEEDVNGERDAFFHFLQRARIIESWYHRHAGLSPLSTPASNIDKTPQQISTRASGTSSMMKKASKFPPGLEVTAASPTNEDYSAETGEFTDIFNTYFLADDVQGMDFGPYISSVYFNKP